jgi:hypothetical protein
MRMTDKPDVWILSPLPGGDNLGATEGAAQAVMFRSRLAPELLAKSVRAFSEAFAGELDQIKPIGQEFDLTEVELSALAGGDGSITILGAEVGGKMEGAIKLVFRRRPQVPR